MNVSPITKEPSKKADDCGHSGALATCIYIRTYFAHVYSIKPLFK